MAFRSAVVGYRSDVIGYGPDVFGFITMNDMIAVIIWTSFASTERKYFSSVATNR